MADKEEEARKVKTHEDLVICKKAFGGVVHSSTNAQGNNPRQSFYNPVV
ncbi:hypothetical protein [Umezakia ovalisporum]